MTEAEQFEFQIFERTKQKKPAHLPRRQKLDEIERRFKMAEYECKSRKKFNFKWLISLDDFRWLCTQACWYCDGKLGKVLFGKGLDRIDSKGDYTMENVYRMILCPNALEIVRQDLVRRGFLEAGPDEVEYLDDSEINDEDLYVYRSRMLT